MQEKRTFTVLFLLMAVLMAGSLGLGVEIGPSSISFGVIVLCLLLAAWYEGRRRASKETRGS
ncbi:hypothetical protein [Marinococcus halophilus]|uniref:hypothetical protein n=1 Tax=Marinococcus halophilus TaxID=1371 RepID=UPI0009A641FD|nr:hypothetical protein [Marinococcus halophilus]